jgi:pimeloyl-ACP methyl ester carboxylesterase
MPESPQLSEAKRLLLDKYLRGELSQIGKAALQPLTTQENPTPAASPAGGSSPQSVLIPIQTGGSQRPFFFFHVHWQGGAFYCFKLASDLGPDQPFYVLEPFKSADLPTTSTLEEMAASYIKLLREVQPEGPYLLGGFCGGGLIAFEIAQQLHTAGEKVDLLVLIEPRAGPAPLRLIAPRLAGGFIRFVGGILRISQVRQFNMFLRLRHLYLLVRYAQYRKDHPFFVALESLHKDWIGTFVWIISRYRPRQYAGKATYFWAEERPGKRRPGWGRGTKARAVEIRIIPGTHDTCRTDHVHEMAEHLQQCLNRVQPSYSSV